MTRPSVSPWQAESMQGRGVEGRGRERRGGEGKGGEGRGGEGKGGKGRLSTVHKMIRCKVTCTNLFSLLTSQSYALHNFSKEHRRKSGHMEKLDNYLGSQIHTLSCLNLVSSLASKRFTRITTLHLAELGCHVTSLSFLVMKPVTMATRCQVKMTASPL